MAMTTINLSACKFGRNKTVIPITTGARVNFGRATRKFTISNPTGSPASLWVGSSNAIENENEATRHENHILLTAGQSFVYDGVDPVDAVFLIGEANAAVPEVRVIKV